MSSDADAAAIVDEFYSILTTEYCNLAAAVILFYDAFITFDREVACFWTAKLNGASLLFFANRWITVTLYVMTLVSFASFPSDKSCSLFERAGEAMLILQYVPGAGESCVQSTGHSSISKLGRVFSALRVYVMSRSKLLGLFVVALSLVPVGANLVHYGYQLSGVIFPPFGCLDTDNTTAALNLRLVIISRAPLIATDILLIWITWSKLRNWGARRSGDIRQYRRLSLSEIMFRGGITYFAVLFTLNVLHLVFSVTAVAIDNGPASLVTEFTAPITAILISHFLLELQEANKMVMGLDPDDPLRSSRDPSFISSLGNFVNPGLSTRSDDDSVEFQVRSRLETPGEEEGGGQPETAKADESLVISPRDLA